MEHSDIPTYDGDVISYLRNKKCPDEEDIQILNKHSFDKLLNKRDHDTINLLFKFWSEHVSQKDIYKGGEKQESLVVDLIKDIFEIKSFSQKTRTTVLAKNPGVSVRLLYFLNNIDTLQEFLEVKSSLPVLSSGRQKFHHMICILDKMAWYIFKGGITTDMNISWDDNNSYPDDLNLILTI